MARPLKEIEQELLKLPHEERARLAHALIVSLDEEEQSFSREELEAAWMKEIHRREQELREGKVQTIPAEDVLGKLRRKFTK